MLITIDNSNKALQGFVVYGQYITVKGISIRTALSRGKLAIYSAFGKYSEPLTFSKCFPSSIYTQYPIMTKQKQDFRTVFKCIRTF
jgi:hypothetical protein